MLERDSVKQALAIGHPGSKFVQPQLPAGQGQLSARVIDGKAVAAKLREEYKERIARLRAEHGVTPGLTVILVGEDPASQVYVRNKIRDCAEVGIRSDADRTARVDSRSRAAGAHRCAQCRRRRARHPHPAAAAETRRDPQGAGAHLGGQGRRRIPSLQRRRPGHRPPGVPALHSLRRAEAARAREASSSTAATWWWSAPATSSASPPP